VQKVFFLFFPDPDFSPSKWVDVGIKKIRNFIQIPKNENSQENPPKESIARKVPKNIRFLAIAFSRSILSIR
jgi:hypothetical protein